MALAISFGSVTDIEIKFTEALPIEDHEDPIYVVLVCELTYFTVYP
jgi:hypothetical protein